MTAHFDGSSGSDLMETFLVGLLWAVGGAVAAAAVAFVVRRYTGDAHSESNALVGQVFTIVSGLNAVLLAFVLIGLFDAVATAREDSYAEAGGLVAVAWAGDALPEPARTRIRTLSHSYAETVLDREWPRMEAARKIDDQGWAQLEELRLTIAGVQPADDSQAEQKTEATNKLWEVYEARQDRLNSNAKRVSPVMWFALIISSLLSISLTYLMSGTRLVPYVVVVATLTATVALLLFAIYELQTPFHGGAQVDPDAFHTALQQLG
jgi:hypothetical protein